MTPQNRLFATGGTLLTALLAIGVYATSSQLTANGQSYGAGQAASGVAPAAANASFSAQLRAALQKEPELVVEAFELYQLREEQRRKEAIAKALPQFIPQIEKLIDQGERVLVQGDPKGDLTIIEFTNYNCPYCRRIQPEVQTLLKADPKIRHVIKAMPNIRPTYPEFAIVAAAAQGDQAKVSAFHTAMMGSEGSLDKPQVLEIAAKIGLDVKKLEADAESQEVAERIQRTLSITDALGIRGTPAMLFPDRITSFIPAAEMAAIVKEIREAR